MEENKYRELLRKKVQLANDCRYFIEKQINPNRELDEEIEERRKRDDTLPISNIDMALYRFKENFFNSIRKIPLGNKLQDYSSQVMEYLNNSFPFCFGINIRDDLFELAPGIEDFTFDLAYYAMAIGATDEQMATIKDVLKSQKIINVPRMEREKTEFGAENYRRVSLDSVLGTTTRIYQADNLFDVLARINDKKVSSFIQYIMQNGGVENSQAIFHGMHFDEDQDKNLYVSEGNHRVFVYKLLKAVKEHITGRKIDSMEVDAGISRIRILPDSEQNEKDDELEL